MLMPIEYMKYLNLIIIVMVIPILAGILNVNSSKVFALNLTTNSSSGMTHSVNNETYIIKQ